MNINTSAIYPVQISQEQILASHFTLSDVPNEIEVFEIEGVEGWKSLNPHPVLSIGKWKTCDPEIAKAGIDRILENFKAEGRGFDWMTGPDDAALVPLLAERGFLAPALSVAAMVKKISLNERPEDSDGISTQIIKAQRNDPVSDIMAKGFDIPLDVARIYHNAYVQPSERQRTDVYVATKTGDEQPSGIGYLSYIGDGPMVLLRVAATLSESRGCGMYRSLIKRRLADAAEAGRQIAVVHAYSEASQSALTNLGFAKAGELQLHRWRP